MTESAIEIPHVGIMWRRKGFIGLDGSSLVVCVAGKALFLLGWLGWLGYIMCFYGCRQPDIAAPNHHYLYFLIP
jgi:hypothetical protein